MLAMPILQFVMIEPFYSTWVMKSGSKTENCVFSDIISVHYIYNLIYLNILVSVPNKDSSREFRRKRHDY